MNPWRRIPVPCCSCGECAIRTEYKQWHGFSRVYVTALVKLADAVRREGRHVERRAMKLTNGEYTNFAKLSWWGLIESFEDGWDLTDKGWRFLHEFTGIPEKVLTFRGRVIGESIGLQKIRDFVDAETWQKAEYVLNRILPTAQDYRQLTLVP